ncbi:hypothetical protein, partial [Treponema sp. R80B11-R83G3]
IGGGIIVPPVQDAWHGTFKGNIGGTVRTLVLGENGGVAMPNVGGTTTTLQGQTKQINLVPAANATSTGSGTFDFIGLINNGNSNFDYYLYDGQVRRWNSDNNTNDLIFNGHIIWLYFGKENCFIGQISNDYNTITLRGYI